MTGRSSRSPCPQGTPARGRGDRGSVVAVAQVLEAIAAGRAAVELQTGQAVPADLRRVGVTLGDGVPALDEQHACGSDGGSAHVFDGGGSAPRTPPPSGRRSLLRAWPACPAPAQPPRRRRARDASPCPGAAA